MSTGEQLAALVADPARVADLDPDRVADALGELEALRARLWVRLHAPPATPAHSSAGNGGPDHLLTAKEAAPLLGVAPRWMYRHAPDLPFTRRLAGGTLRFSERGLERWKESRR
jgi:predicted DNA-binding transcriptional regulator AlpA